MSGIGTALPVRIALRRIFAFFVVMAMLGAGAGVATVILVNQRFGTVANRLDPLSAWNAQILQSMTDAETGLRGYQLTGQRLFLAPYDQGTVSFAVAIAQGRRLAGSDVTVHRLLGVERAAATTWLVDFALPTFADSSAAIPSNVGVSPQQGKALFDRFRAANAAVRDYTASAISKARSDVQRIEREGLVDLSLIGLAALALVGLSSVRLDRALTVPLESVAGTLGRLAAGDRKVRATEAGTAEVQAVTRAVNVLAEESERIALEQQNLAQLQAISMTIARQINEHLDLNLVLVESVRAIGSALQADRSFVRLLRDGVLGDAIAEWHTADQEPRDYSVDPPPLALARFLMEVANGTGAFVADDLQAPLIVGNPDIAAHLQRLNIGAMIVCPLRSGSELVGILVLLQIGRPRHWSPMEVSLAETVVADLARSVLHAQVYERQLQLVAELQDLHKVKSDFVATVSHELRTPLTSISGYVELLSDGEAGPMSDEQLGMLAIVDVSATRLRCLIEDLLMLSRIEEGAFRVGLSPTNLSEVVRTACGSIAPSATLKGLSLRVDAGDGGVQVLADADQMERALRNLLHNAVKFTPTGGTVSVTCRQTAGRVTVAVTDTGIGIPAGEQGRLFDRFFRASNALEQAIPGTGLGLAIVRSIVEHHHGSLEVTSTAGVGTSVTICLPVLAAAQEPCASGVAGGVGS